VSSFAIFTKLGQMRFWTHASAQARRLRTQRSGWIAAACARTVRFPRSHACIYVSQHCPRGPQNWGPSHLARSRLSGFALYTDYHVPADGNNIRLMVSLFHSRQVWCGLAALIFHSECLECRCVVLLRDPVLFFTSLTVSHFKGSRMSLTNLSR
jgi:hypothetical protein